MIPRNMYQHGMEEGIGSNGLIGNNAMLNVFDYGGIELKPGKWVNSYLLH